MGLEITNMGVSELEDILYETNKFNHEDFSSFKEALFDMYGGIQTENYKKLVDFIKNDMKLASDADLTHLTTSQKQKIVAFVSQLQ